MIDRVQLSTGAAAGSAGSATATGYSAPVFGKVLAVHVDYQDSPPAATCDFTLSDEDDPASEAIVSLVDQATDIKVYPRRLVETSDGTDVTYDGTRKVYEPYIVHGRLEATIAQANANDSCIVTVWLEA
jgi:hypothetical protein